MKNRNKIAIVFLFAIMGVLGQYFYKNHQLHKEYVEDLQNNENEYIKTFYLSSFNGIITYIKSYERNPDKYVIEVLDSSKNKITIGKVQITNFSRVVEGDSIKKPSNSYGLEIIGINGRVMAVVKYE